MGTTTVPKTATALLEQIENRLGWDPYAAAHEAGVPVWQLRSTEAGKINAAIKRKPGRGKPPVTLENLALAVDYAVRHGEEITAPYGVVYLIQKALDEVTAAAPPTGVDSDTEASLAEAVELEQALGDERSAYWLGRFARVVGPARKEVLVDWAQERASLPSFPCQLRR